MTDADRPRPLMGHEFGKALIAAGIITPGDLVRRVVIDARVDKGHLVEIYVERFGDTRLLDVVPTLSGVEIRETPQSPADVVAYRWTNPTSGQAHLLDPHDVQTMIRGEIPPSGDAGGAKVALTLVVFVGFAVAALAVWLATLPRPWGLVAFVAVLDVLVVGTWRLARYARRQAQRRADVRRSLTYVDEVTARRRGA